MLDRKTNIILYIQTLIFFEEDILLSKIIEITSYSKFLIYYIKQIAYK